MKQQSTIASLLLKTLETRFLCRLPFLALAIVCSLNSLSAQTSWTGNFSTSWFVADNWTAGVPDATDDVIIEDKANDPVISGAAVAKSVHVKSGASLLISTVGSLTINGFFNNGGFTTGLLNKGSVTNNGDLALGTVSSTGDYCIWNEGTFLNHLGATLSINRSDFVGLLNRNQGIFTNRAMILIGNAQLIDDTGIVNAATFTNAVEGEIKIDRCGSIGMGNVNGGTFDNLGKIAIGNTVSVGDFGLRNVDNATFNNKPGGEIRVNRCTVAGIDNYTSTFNNNGKIKVGNLNYVGDSGIRNYAAFNNFASGEISIDNGGVLFNNEDGATTNEGKITIGAIAGGAKGLTNKAIFKHTNGDIKIDDCGEGGLSNFGGTFTNSAKISIGSLINNGNFGLTNSGTFYNNTGGEIKIDRNQGSPSAALYNNNTFENAAKITIGSLAECKEYGIWNEGGTFNNNTGGNIKIDRTTQSGLQNEQNATFNNTAKIAIGSMAECKPYGLRNNGAMFNNNAGGEITIDRTTSFGLWNKPTATFNNAAKLAIGSLTSFQGDGIYNEASFNNNTGGEITIDRSTMISTGLTNREGGTFTNNASIQIGSIAALVSTGLGNAGIFYNNANGNITIQRTGSFPTMANAFYGVFHNHGSINIGSALAAIEVGLLNAHFAIFNNYAGATLRIDNVSKHGYWSFQEAVCNNEGQFIIGALQSGGVDGLFTEGETVFNNKPGGEIKIDRCQNGLHVKGGTFNNEAKLAIGSVAFVYIGLWNEASFHNKSGAELTIDRTIGLGATGLYNGKGVFNNHASIKIGSIIAAEGVGFFNDVVFNNKPNAEIYIDHTGAYGLENGPNGTLTNEARIIIGENASVGARAMYNFGLIDNKVSGEIELDNSTQFGLYNYYGNYQNFGKTSIGSKSATGDYAVNNKEGEVQNKACGILRVFGPIRNDQTFGNAGLFSVNTALAHTNNALLNNGVIEYPQGNPIPNVTNNDMIVAPAAGQDCSTVSPALQIGGANSFTAAANWYKDPTLTQLAGTYNQPGNTFTPTNLVGPGPHTLYFSVSDNDHNCPRTVSIKVTLGNNEPPSITCPADKFLSADANCSALLGQHSPLAVGDDCLANPSVSQSPAAATLLSGHGDVEIVTLTVSDGVNEASCQFKVTLQDNTKPSIVCPTDKIVAADNNCSGTLGAWQPLSLSDNCTAQANITLSQNPDPATPLNGHNAAQLVTLSANDGKGNTQSCAFLVTLKDQSKPGIVCPADKIINTDVACAGVVGTHAALSTSDNCSGSVTVNQSPAPATPLNGHNDFETVTLTADDGNGNTQVCQFKVTLKDQRKPNITCPAAKIIDANDNCSGTLGAWSPASVSDNCTANPGLSQTPAPATLLNGNNDSRTVTLTATDEAGNTRTCTFKVTLKDKAKPTLVCPANKTIHADAACQAEIGSQSPAALSDNCTANPSLQQVPDPSTVLIGHGAWQEVTLTATDAAGNWIACAFTVTLHCPAGRGEANSEQREEQLDFMADGLEAKVYPNPNAGQFVAEVLAEQGGDVTFTLHDAMGKMALQQQANLVSGQVLRQTFDLGELPAGVYSLNVRQAGQHRVLKVVVQR